MIDEKISYEEFKDLLEDMQSNGSKEDRALAKDYLKHIKEKEKTAERKKHKDTKTLSTHELIVKLTEMLEVGSQLAASLKTSVELPYDETYKSSSASIKAYADKVASDLEKYKEYFKEWYLETAYAISRYEKNTYHLHEFISDRNRYVIVRNKQNTPDELLTDFGHHIVELVKILKSLEKQDTTLTISLSIHGSNKPKITFGDEVLYFKTMRDGHAYNFINYCLNNKPSVPVSLKELNKELNIQIGVTNINQALKNSPFDPNDGLLRLFVESSPQALTVKPTINVIPTYLDKLRDEAVPLD